MRINKLTLWTGLLMGSVLPALAVPVTFQVNMDYQVNIAAAFAPATGTVTCRGSFNSWGNTFVLTNSTANPFLYTGTTEVAGAAGDTIQYKYVFNNNTAGSSDQWESVSSPNRFYKLTGSAQVVPEAYFSDKWAGAQPVDITFHVNMSAQIGAGNFDPATGTVEARGAFNGWGGGFTLTNTTAQPGIYSGTYTEAEVPPGATREYKFVYVDSTNAVHWENLLGYPNGNRWFLVPSNNVDLATYYYGDASGFPIKAAVYFQLDMNAQIQVGNFDRAADQAWVRGNTVGWGSPPEGLQLFEDTSRPGVYTNLYTIASQLTGAVIEYKHVIWRPGTLVTVWEDGSNKTLTFTGTEPTNSAGYHVITLGPSYFNGMSPSDLLMADTLVTFRVDMSNAHRFGGASFDPANEGVWINGNMLPSGWNTYGSWGSMPAETKMYDDGVTAGDAVAGDKIYTWQITLPKGANPQVQYKYGIESGDNEAPSGQDHMRYVRATGTYVMPIDTFGTQTQEISFGNLAIAPATGGKVQLTWLGRPGVHLQTATNLGGAWVDDMATDGLMATNYTIGTTPMFFRLIKP